MNKAKTVYERLRCSTKPLKMNPSHFRTLQIQQELSTMNPIQPRRITTEHQHTVTKQDKGYVKLRETQMLLIVTSRH